MPVQDTRLSFYTQLRILPYPFASSSIRLETSVLGLLNINFTAWNENSVYKYKTLTPFNPEIGYPLDAHDFSFEKRKQKLKRIKRKLDVLLAIKGIHFSYDVETAHDPFIFRQLFLVIKLSNGSSFAERIMSAISPFDHQFFPIDANPLPTVEVYSGTEATRVNLGEDEGFNILLPDNIELLKQIKAKFLFLLDVD